jgi:mannose-6-phosphate isomerase
MSFADLRDWIVGQALPLWAGAGFDEASGQFVEQIAFDGTPMLDTPRRVMVQARQIYVFGLAHERGWLPGGDRLALSAYRQIVARYGVAGGGNDGWAFSVDRAGRVVDPTRDLYAQAFVLLALATIQRLTGGEEPRRLARETLAFLDSQMAAPSGGYGEALPGRRTPRRQNPHMHLLEALLAWHALAPGEGFDTRALAIVELFERRFLVRRGERVALVEHFDAGLSPLGGPDHGFEPGHHFEWVWLLAECARLTGRDCAAQAQALWSNALRCGFRADGAILDAVSLSGAARESGVRLWPLTEALKASRAGHAVPVDMAGRSVDELAGTLLKLFLRPAPSGLWFDHFDEQGRLRRECAPASSLYHLCCALAQYPDDLSPGESEFDGGAAISDFGNHINGRSRGR